MPRRFIVIAKLAAISFAPTAIAENRYWNGIGLNWDSVTSWSVDSANPSPNPAAIPGILDIASFNITGVNEEQAVNLNAPQAILGMSVVSPGIISIHGGSADQTLVVGASGIQLGATAGYLNIGSTTGGQKVDISLQGSQLWSNSSSAVNASGITVMNDVILASAGSNTLTFGGTSVSSTKIFGSIKDGVGILGINMAASNAAPHLYLSGSNTYSGPTTVTRGTLVVTNPNSLGSTVSGTTVADGAMLRLVNAGTVVGESLTLAGSGFGAISGYGALNSTAGVNRWTGNISVNTGTTTGRIGAVGGSTLVLDGDLGATGTGTLVFYTGDPGGSLGLITVNGNISFPGQRLVKTADAQSSGTLILNGTNDYGNTTVGQGTLQIGNGGTTGTLGSGAVTISNPISAPAVLAFKRSDNIVVPNAISGDGSIAHIGRGTVTLTGANTHFGATSVSGGGTLTLDYSKAPQTSGLIGPGLLTLAGSKVKIIGKGTGSISQYVGGIILNAGHSTLVIDSNGGSATNLGASGGFGRSAGGTLAIQRPANGSITVNSTTPGIIGGYITLGDSDWAANDGAGNIVPLATYSSDLTANGNLDVPAGGGVLSVAPSSIRFSAEGSNSITLPANRTISSGGILVTPNVGPHLTEISGSFTLQSGNFASDLIVFQNNPSGGLTINSRIGSSLTKAGEGLLTLTGSNTVGMVTRISAGTLSISTASNLGNLVTNPDVLIFPTGSTGTLQITGNGTFSFTRGFKLDGDGSIEVPTLASFTPPAAATGEGSLTKRGDGTLNYSAPTSLNSYRGATIIKGGTIQTNTLANGGVSSGIGASTNDAFNLVLDGGALRYASSSVAASTDRLLTVGISGGILDSSGGSGSSLTFTNTGTVAFTGTNTARSFTLAGTNLDANIFAPILGDNGTGATSLQKAGAGLWTLTGSNTYSGSTTISGGTLVAGLNGALGNGNVSVLQTAINLTISTGVSNAIANAATLSLAGDGIVDNAAVAGYAYLASGVNELVGGLVLGGTSFFDPGTYGATGSGATHIFDDYFKGTGVVTLIPEPSAAVALISGLGVLIGAQRTRRRR